MRDVREITNRIYDAVEEGVLTWETVAAAALSYMSEDEVAEMAEMNEFFAYEEDEDEEGYLIDEL